MQPDRQNFDHLYATNVRVVRRFILHRCGDATLADRLTAQAFLRAWDVFGAAPPPDVQPQRWLLRIARTVLVEHWRAEGRSLGEGA